MNTLLDLLNGKKTYLAAVGAALLAGYYFQRGDLAEAQKFAVLALGFAGLRHAITKES